MRTILLLAIMLAATTSSAADIDEIVDVVWDHTDEDLLLILKSDGTYILNISTRDPGDVINVVSVGTYVLEGEDKIVLLVTRFWVDAEDLSPLLPGETEGPLVEVDLLAVYGDLSRQTPVVATFTYDGETLTLTAENSLQVIHGNYTRSPDSIFVPDTPTSALPMTWGKIKASAK